MNAEVYEWRQAFRGMMRLVQLPQRGDAVLERVVEEEAEFVGDEERERARRVQRQIRRLRLRARPEQGTEKRGDSVADPRRRDHCPADDRPQRRKAEYAIGEVCERRSGEGNPAGEEGGDERPDA